MRRHRWRVVAAGVMGLAALGLIVAHTPFVRARVLSWAIARLEPLGVRVDAAELTYNLLTLRLGVRDVSVAAPGAAAPFLRAEALRMDLPWSIAWGPLAIQSFEVDEPRLTVECRADGSCNLPSLALNDTGATPSVGPLEINRLLIRDLSVLYTDERGPAEVAGSGITLDLRRDRDGPAAGVLSASQPITVQAAGRTTQATLNGRLAFDGSTLAVEALDVGTPELRLHLDGRIGLFADEPRAAFRYDARADVKALGPWMGLEDSSGPTGDLALSGAIEGPLDNPIMSITLAGDRLAVPSVGAVALNGQSRLTTTEAVVESLRVEAAGGTVALRGRVQFDAATPSELSAEWSNLDLETLSRTFGPLPVRLASTVAGAVALQWTGQDPQTVTGQIEATLQPVETPTHGLALDGRVVVEVGQQRWSLAADPHVEGVAVLAARLQGRLEADALSSTLDGSTTVEIRDLGRAVDRLASAGYLLVDQAATGRLQGAATASVVLAGTLGAPRFSGQVDATNVQIGTHGPGRATATFDGTTRRMAIGGARLDVGTNTISGEADIDWPTGRTAGTISGDLPDLALLSSSLPAAWRLQGQASLEATVGGRLSNPTVSVNLAGTNLTIAGQTIDALRTDGVLANRVVTVKAFELTRDDGHLTMTARYEIPRRRYAAEITAERLTVSPYRPKADVQTSPDDAAAPFELPIDTRIDANLAGEGTLDAPHFAGTVTLAHVDIGEYRLGAVSADVDIDPMRARVRTEIPSAAATFDGAITLRDRRFSTTVSAVDVRLADVLRSTGPATPTPLDAPPPSITGSVTLQGTASGPLDDLTAAAVDVRLAVAALSVDGTPVAMNGPAHVQYEERRLTVDGLELRTGTTTLSARGRVGRGTSAGEQLNLVLAGRLEDLAPWWRLAPAARTFDARGALDVRLHASGDIERPDLTAAVSLTNTSVTFSDMPAVHDASLQATYDSGSLRVASVRALWQDAEVQASAELPLGLLSGLAPERVLGALRPAPGPARAEVIVGSVTPNALVPWLGRERVDAMGPGRVDARATIAADALDVGHLTGDITLDRVELELARIPISQRAPTRLRLAGGRLSVVEWSWAGASNSLDVSGSVELAGAAPTLDLGVAGSLDLRLIGAFAPDVATSGRARLDVRITGNTNDPEMVGDISLADAAVVLRNPRLAISNVRGSAALTKGTITLRDVTGNANGGTVRLSGRLGYHDFAVTNGALSIGGQGLALALSDLQSEVDADLTLAFADGTPTLSGRVTVTRGIYREPLSLTQQLVTTATTGLAAPAAEVEPGPFDGVRLDVAVVSADDIVVDNNYARIGIGSNVRLAGTVGEPALSGRLTVQEGGRVFLGGRTYQVRRGTVDFTNPTRIEPTVDLALETRVRIYDVTLGVTGTPETIEASLRSPGLSQQDVVSLLLTGQLADQSAAIPEIEIARGQLLMLLSGELLGFAGRAVGLDSVQIARGGVDGADFDLIATDTDPSARLTVVKSLRRDVEMVFSQDLHDSGDLTWIAIYRPLPNIEIRGTTRDDNSRAYEFRHDVTFGAPPRDALSGSADTRPRDVRVAAVRLTGSPGVAEPTLAGLLRLKAGDAFDFFRWQDDQDRLLAWYHDRGYLEARVTPHRQDTSLPGTAQGVSLDYEVESGPLTVLNVHGADLPGDVVGRMREAWTQAVFDGFLIDDLRGLVRSAVARNGHLQAEVTVTVTSTSDPPAKTIDVAIVPGPRFDTRTITFEGQEPTRTSDLETLVDTQRTDGTAFLSPSTILPTIEGYYRARGFLDVQVDVGEPVFTGASATLPVRVHEGPAYRIGNVYIQGVHARPEADIRDAAGVETGAPYLPAAVEPARRRVEAEYLTAGYTNARVSVVTAVDKSSSRVDVTIDVEEGRRQMLSAVDVRGANVTTRGTIDHALDLSLGKALSRDQVYAAQKRLYDIGVLQSAEVAIEPVTPPSEVAPDVQPVRAVVTLREMPTYRFRYGFRLNDEVGPVEPTRQVRPVFVADLLRRNLFGRAMSAGVAGQVEKDRRLARGMLSLPTLFGMPVVTNLFATTSREYTPPVDEFDVALVERVTEFTVEQRLRPARRMAASYGYRFGHRHIFEPRPDPNSFNPPQDFRTTVARLTGTYTWDTRDDPFDAHRGWLHSSGVEFGARRLGSDARFVRYLAQQYYFRDIGHAVVLASGLRLGAGRGFGDQDLDEKFFAGGSASVRGFSEDALGPQGYFGASGGNGLVLMNQEVRFPLYRWVRGVGFFDAGNVFASAAEISFLDLEAGTGVGLRVHSPFALFRIDFGVPLTRRQQEPRGRWYFAIGQTF